LVYFRISLRYVLAVSPAPQNAQRRKMTDIKLERIREETPIAYPADRLWGLKKNIKTSIRFDDVPAGGWSVRRTTCVVAGHRMSPFGAYAIRSLRYWNITDSPYLGRVFHLRLIHFSRQNLSSKTLVQMCVPYKLTAYPNISGGLNGEI